MNIFKLSAIAVSTLALAACDSSSSDDKPTPVINTTFAAVQTVAPDYSSSQVAMMNTKDKTLIEDGLFVDASRSDYVIETNGQDIYHIGRSGIDTVTKYSANDLYDAVYSYSTNMEGEQTSGNPYSIAFISNTKAYVVRYDASNVLVVNPSAEKESDFITAEIDLSAYVTNKGGISASSAVILGENLYVAMQRQDANWTPQTAYVAVISTTTDTEIETNADDSDAMKGIPLQGINPLQDSLFATETAIYVTTHNSYGSTTLANSKIERIEPTSFALTEVLNASDIENNTTEQLGETVIVNDEKGYFYAGSGWPTVSKLYEFNPSTGEITNSDIAGTGTASEGIADIALDENNGELWIAIQDPSNPGVDVYNTEDNTLSGNRIPTELNPTVIRFGVSID